jgi:hypothetical protein
MVRQLFAAAVVAVLCGAAAAADLKSGPQAGEKVGGPFHPLNINGEDAGRKACLYCKNQDLPVAVVFARTADDPVLQKLIAALDEATVKNEKAEMGSFVVYLSVDEGLPAKLKEQADKARYQKIILSVEESVEGPAKYKIAREADVTVLLYKDYVVEANYAFGKGKMTEADVKKIVADVSKIVPGK